MEIKATGVQKLGENDRYIQTLFLCVILRIDTWQVREEDVQSSHSFLSRSAEEVWSRNDPVQTHTPQEVKGAGVGSGLTT